MIRALRAITNNTVNDEPEWRRRTRELTTGYRPKNGAYTMRSRAKLLKPRG